MKMVPGGACGGGREGRRTQKRLSAGDGSGDGWNVGSAFDDVTAFLKPFVAVVLRLQGPYSQQFIFFVTYELAQ